MDEKEPVVKEVDAKEKYLKEVSDAINSAPSDPNVRIALRYIARLAGFFQNPVVVNTTTGDVLVSSSIYNSGRESLYHDLRRLMSSETKNIVERSE